MEIPAQIDTAAGLSVIPGRLVDELRLLPLDSVSALGFGGHLLTLPTFLVELQIRESLALVERLAEEGTGNENSCRGLDESGPAVFTEPICV